MGMLEGKSVHGSSRFHIGPWNSTKRPSKNSSFIAFDKACHGPKKLDLTNYIAMLVCPNPGCSSDPLRKCIQAQLSHEDRNTTLIFNQVFLFLFKITIYIWVNYNISLTWIEAIWGWFPLLTMIPVRSQWGRYNLPRYIYTKFMQHRICASN